MANQSTEAILRELLLTDVGEPKSKTDLNSPLRENFDSVDIVSIVSQAERRFGIRFSQQELEKLATLQDLVGLIDAKLAPK